MAIHTFLWHDYETFGVQPRRDRPAQFAAIRTDADLNEIGEPIMLYCKPADDFLPDPQSCLITGITPQLCLERGIPEYQFAAEIEKVLSATGTIGVGYNTIRFDDEVTRFLFWRNLIDPYAREWQNNCGRWDILDVVRTAYALRPDGIIWPNNSDGRPSFKLEDIARANNLIHEKAHDALSDVRATIALARLIKTNHPKLFDFCLGLHKKERVASEIGLPYKRPFLHITGMLAAERGCLGIVWPLAVHPTNRNEIIVWDLSANPAELMTLDADTIRQRMFSAANSHPEGTTRLPIKTIHLNKSPIVINNLKTLSKEMTARWGLDFEAILAHAEIAAAMPDMQEMWKTVFYHEQSAARDIDEDLYGGFVGDDDRRTLQTLRVMPPEKLAVAQPTFKDPRLEELIWRYRARNFPDTLSEDERQRWEAHRITRLLHGSASTRTVEEFYAQIDALSKSVDANGEAILGALYDYAESIAPVRRQ